MKIGISSWTYTWNIGVAGYDRPPAPFGWRELLQEAMRLHADVLQVADNYPLEQVEELPELSRCMKQAGIALETGTRGVRPDKLMRFVELSEKLNVKLVRTLLHDGSEVPDIATAYAQLREIVPELERRGIVLAIENHDLYASRELRGLIERLDSPCVRVCLDTVNNFAQGESVQEVLRELGSLTACFHCKDFTIRRIASGMGFELTGCPVGKGMLHVENCLPALPAAAEMSFIVELWTPWQGEISRTCHKEREWSEISMQYLRKLKEEGGRGE